MAEQNARLEGYMKAKLTYMGAIDSSAGLTTLGLIISNAQQNLLLYQGQFNKEMVSLELKKSEIMGNYFDAVQEQIINLQSKQGSAIDSLIVKLDEIDSQELASIAEANTMKIDAITKLTDNLYSFETDQREWEWKLYTEQWDMAMKETKFVNDIQNSTREQAINNLELMIQAGVGKDLGQLPKDMQQSMLEMASIAGLPNSYVSEALSSQKQKLVSNTAAKASEYGVDDNIANMVATLASRTIAGEITPEMAGLVINKNITSSNRAAAMSLYFDVYQEYVNEPNLYFQVPASFLPGEGPQDIPNLTPDEIKAFYQGVTNSLSNE